MKAVKLISAFALILAAILSSCSVNEIEKTYPESFPLALKNKLDTARNGESVRINIPDLKQKYPEFNPEAFVVLNGDAELPSQAVDYDDDGNPDFIVFITDLIPDENQTLTLRYSKEGKITRDYKKLSHAELSEKTDYNLINGNYTGGKFEPVKKVKVPADHVAHDALYKFEGPGWESDKVGYRLYLDDRNRTDIWGKKVSDMVLPNAGVNDLVSDGNESYQSMLEWGKDIFKVGNSLGIGALGAWYGDKVETVSKTDSIFCDITADGPVFSNVRLSYFGWQVADSKFNLVSDYSIDGHSRLTRHDVSLSPSPELLCTGLAKHPDTELIEPAPDSEGDWQYLGLYGKQTLADDNLGIAVFYRKSEMTKVTEDDLSYLVILKPASGKLTYYFAAAWQQEPNGIKNIGEFEKYLKETAARLNSPVTVSF